MKQNEEGKEKVSDAIKNKAANDIDRQDVENLRRLEGKRERSITNKRGRKKPMKRNGKFFDKAKEIREEGEEWADAIKRASIVLREEKAKELKKGSKITVDNEVYIGMSMKSKELGMTLPKLAQKAFVYFLRQSNLDEATSSKLKSIDEMTKRVDELAEAERELLRDRSKLVNQLARLSRQVAKEGEKVLNEGETITKKGRKVVDSAKNIEVKKKKGLRAFVLRFVKDWPETWSLILAIPLFVYFPYLVHSMFPQVTFAVYDPFEELHRVVFAVVALLIANAMAFGGLRWNFRTLFSYWQNKFTEEWSDLKPVQRVSLLFSFYLALLVLFVVLIFAI